MRLLLVMIFFVASVVGLHFSDINFLDVYREKKASSKKTSVVKPKFLREKIKDVTPEIPVYTFFETLNDPTMTRYVGLNGKMLPTPPQPKKILTPVVFTNNTVAPPLVEKIVKSELLTKPAIKQNGINKTPVIEGPPRYAVQVGSFLDARRAGALKMRLQKKGFDAFLMQTEIADDAWHRVFLGRYADEQKAQDAARLARSDYKLNAVVVSKTN